METGLLPVKRRSFCGENPSHPCIPSYSDRDWTRKSLTKQRKMMGLFLLLLFFKRKVVKNPVVEKSKQNGARMSVASAAGEGMPPILGSLGM